MRKDNQFGVELIGQEGLVPGQLSDAEGQETRAMIEAQWTRTRRMKWVTIGSWILVACCFVVFGSIDAGRQGPLSPWLAAAGFATRGLVLVAVVMTISYYVRYRAASMSEIRMRLAVAGSNLVTPT